MKKTDIVKRIHQQTGLSEEEAAMVFDGALEILVSTLQKGEPIVVQEFGKFMVRNKLARQGRNPRTGETLMIPARRVVTFRASTVLTTGINSVPAKQQEAVARTA